MFVFVVVFLVVATHTGPMRVDGNMSDAPNYFPNSFSGPAPADKSHTTWHAEKLEGEVARYPSGHEDNFSQASTMFFPPS